LSYPEIPEGWKMNKDNGLAIVAVAAIAIVAMFAIPESAKDIALTVVGGVVGYLTGQAK
jgi:uncharacterized membrane protein (UPF0136 family)